MKTPFIAEGPSMEERIEFRWSWFCLTAHLHLVVRTVPTGRYTTRETERVTSQTSHEHALTGVPLNSRV